MNQQELTNRKTKTRNYSLDVLRILGALTVILTHCSGDFVTGYAGNSPEFFWGNLFCSPAHICVPIFVMISGALMLDENKDIPFRKILTVYIPNLIGLLVFWSFLYCMYYQVLLPLSNGKGLEPMNILRSFLTGHFHMWYLYMSIGLYLATPILRSFVRKENKTLVLYFLVIAAAFQFTQPLLNKFALVREEFSILQEMGWKANLSFFGGYTAYYLLGWYMVHVGVPQRLRKWIYAGGVFSLLLTIAYLLVTRDYGNGYSDLNILLAVYSAAVFLWISGWTCPISPFWKRLLPKLSSLCFGVYILHPFIQGIYLKWFPYTGNPGGYIFLFFLVTAVATFALCHVISRIPVLRKSIRG